MFVDTNVLVYAYSEADPLKCAEAANLLNTHAGRFVLSTQVVQEFYAAGLRKLKLPRAKLKRAVQELLKLPVVTITGDHILSALEFEETYCVSFWDGLILAAAASVRAEILYTEDLDDGQRYGTVTARNPFANRPIN